MNHSDEQRVYQHDQPWATDDGLVCYFFKFFNIFKFEEEA